MKSTREDVESIIGEVDEFTLERILAVGASEEELHEAALAAVMEFEMGEKIAPPSNERVSTLAAIIEMLLHMEADEDEEYSDSYLSTLTESRHDRG